LAWKAVWGRRVKFSDLHVRSCNRGGFELEQTVEGFLNEDLVEYKENTLVVRDFLQLQKLYGNGLKLEECIGFKKLLFLGGKDEINNLERIDMEVYWEVNYQIYRKIQSLPEGQLINKISFD
jgi:hypothetical protein